jgi:hypothetical protein
MNKFILSIVRIKYIRNFLQCVLRCHVRQSRKIIHYLKNTDEKKLQIGFGTNPLSGWLNVGISLRELWYGAYLDAGKPFPLPDASFSYVYSEHLFEHLTYKQAQNMSKRIYLSLAQMGGTELDYIKEAFDTNWVVPLGPNVNAFEADLETFVGQGKKVVALSAGTASFFLWKR